MTKKTLISMTAVTFTVAFTLQSCTQSDDLNGGKISGNALKEQIFDFSMEQELNVDINYNFNAPNYAVLFGLYDQNPLTETEHGSELKEIEPLYRGATDVAGKFNDRIRIPAVFKEVWLYSPYLGTGAPICLKIANKSIQYNRSINLSEQRLNRKTRAYNDNNLKYPDGWSILGNWDEYGTPDYSLPELKLPTEDLYFINKVLVQYSKETLESRYPEIFQAGLTSDIEIIKSTKLRLGFINSTAGMLSTVGYFTYPTGNPPKSINDIKHIIAFPNAQPFDKVQNGIRVGALASGEQIQMKYWDGEKYVEEFPAGVTIGWFLEAASFEAGGNIRNTGHSRYSLKQLNKDDKQRTVALRDPKTDRLVAIGFEDNIDMRYNDATFYLDIEQPGAIAPNLPLLPEEGTPPSDKDNYSIAFGTLAFEDLWPHMGDYDMNDLVIEYRSKIYKTINGNKVYKIEDEFTPLHRGGVIVSGFGYQLTNVPNGAVRNVTVEGIETTSRFMEGQMVETGQNHPTILLFDELTPDLLHKKIKVTISLTDVDQTLISAPHNPFTFANSSNNRSKEIHLVNYPPTSKADPKLFGVGDDASDPSVGLYYASKLTLNQFPFVLNMSGVVNFPIQKEMIRIDRTYPRFKSWVDSKGNSDKDWYKD